MAKHGLSTTNSTRISVVMRKTRKSTIIQPRKCKPGHASFGGASPTTKNSPSWKGRIRTCGSLSQPGTIARLHSAQTRLTAIWDLTRISGAKGRYHEPLESQAITCAHRTCMS